LRQKPEAPAAAPAPAPAAAAPAAEATKAAEAAAPAAAAAAAPAPLLLPRLPLLLKLPSRLKPLLLMLPSPQWMLARPLLKPARAQWTLARPLLKPPRSNISCFNKNGASAPFFYCSDLIVRFVLSHVTPVKSLIRSGYTYPVKRASQRTRRCANGQFGQIVALAQMGDNQMLQDEQSI
jgi:hypothetical protein